MIGQRRKHLVLSMFVHPAGYHNYSWRGAGSRAEEWGQLPFLQQIARQAEAAKFDAVFLADTTSAVPLLSGDTKVAGFYEPLTSLSALAASTSRIGLIGTASTTFNHPYNLARQFAGLDLLSDGRAGWNIVTSWQGNENYGLAEMPDGPTRYRQAQEFVAVAKALWESWDEDAVVSDRESGWWIDPSKIHAVDHVGESYDVKGPLNLRRTPQAGPVLVQAGSSGPGVDLGATYAELIYTAQPIRDSSAEFYANYKKIVHEKGRDPEDVAILPGIMPIVGRTEAEAQEYARELESLVDLEHGRRQLQKSLGFDISDVDLDETIPAERFDLSKAAMTSRAEIFRKRTLEQSYSLRALILESAKASGHLWTVGSAGQVAEQMIDWFDRRACDGFSVNAPSFPEGYDRVCELLVPELQERGYFHDDYAGDTLRENIRAGRA